MPFSIAVFRQEGLPVGGLGVDVVALLQELDDVDVAVVDLDEVMANGVEADCFCNAHGEVYPLAIEERIYEFISAGGGLLHVGGTPFETAMEQADGAWRAVQTLPASPSEKAPTFRERLGIQSYRPSELGHAADSELVHVFDADLIGIPPLRGSLPELGLTVTTTVLPQTAGEGGDRPSDLSPCRMVHQAGMVRTPDGRNVMPSLLLVKSWGNVYVDQSWEILPWAIFTGQVADELPPGILRRMLDWLTTPAQLEPLDPPQPTVQAGQSVPVHARIFDARRSHTWTIRARQGRLTLDEFRSHAPIAWHDASCEKADATGLRRTIVKDDPDAFILPVRFEVIDIQGQVRDYSESAVIPSRNVGTFMAAK